MSLSFTKTTTRLRVISIVKIVSLDKSAGGEAPPSRDFVAPVTLGQRPTGHVVPCLLSSWREDSLKIPEEALG